MTPTPCSTPGCTRPAAIAENGKFYCPKCWAKMREIPTPP